VTSVILVAREISEYGRSEGWRIDGIAEMGEILEVAK